MLEKLKRYISGKKSESQGWGTTQPKPEWWPLNFLEGYEFSRPSFKEYLSNGFGKNPYVFMVVDRIADLASQLEHVVLNSNDKENTDKDILDFLKRPNDTQNFQDFFYEIASNLLTTGNCVIRKITSVGFKSANTFEVLFLPHVDYQTLGGDLKDPIIYWTYKGKIIEPEDILHISYADPASDTHWGVGALRAGLMAYEGSNNTFTASASIHNNRGTTGVISSGDSDLPMHSAEQKQLQKAWNSQNAGAKKTGKTYVTTANVKYHQIGMSPTDLKLIEFNPQYLRIICGLFGIDSGIFNDPTSKTYNNALEGKKSLYTNAVLPLDKKISRALTNFVLRDNFKKDAKLTTDITKIDVFAKPDLELSKKIVAEVKAGILTPEQAFEILYPNLAKE